MTENLNVYYYSDPDGSTKDLRCHAIYTEIPFSDLPWHVHTEKPDESLQDPVWSLEANGWVESSKDNQGAMLAKQAEQVDKLIKANEQLQADSDSKDKTITELQRTLQQSSFATGQLSAQFNQFGSSVTKALQEVTTAVNELKKEGDK